MKIILTGVTGFIGAQTARLLLDEGHEVTGLDNLDDYYDPQLKRDRLSASTCCLRRFFWYSESSTAYLALVWSR